MKIPTTAVLAAITLAALSDPTVGFAASSQPQPAAEGSIARGRYLVSITGCHDCHTAGHPQTEGHSATADWLTGQSVGFKGPWGTTYPANLRLVVQSLSQSQWLVYARAPRRPPMPWFNLRQMSDTDLIDIYSFIRSLGPQGVPAPAAVPPGGKVVTPYIVFEAQNLPRTAPRPPVTSNSTPLPEVVIRAKREPASYASAAKSPYSS